MDPLMNGKARYVSSDEEGLPVTSLASSVVVLENKQWPRSWTRLEILLTVLSVCLLVAVAILAIAVAVKSSQPSPASQALSTKLQPQSEYELCLTPECVKAAARMLEALDPSVRPCDDFFSYACGSWSRVNVIPDDRATYNTFAKLRDDVQILLRDLLEQPVDDHDCEATRKAKVLYASCIDEESMDKGGLEPLYSLLQELGGWPVLMGSAWKSEEHDLIKSLADFRLYNQKLLIEIYVSADDKNSGSHIIHLDQPCLGMQGRDYYLKGRDDPAILAYERFARDVAVMLGANLSLAERDTADLIELEIQLANITVPREHRRDTELLYNKMTIEELEKRIPFEWQRYISLVFESIGVTVNASEKVVVYSPTYFGNLIKLLKSVDKRVFVNYMFWRLMMERVNDLPSKYRVVKKDFFKVVYGSEMDRSKWRECVNFVSETMGNAVGRLFVKKHFDEAAKAIALDMIHDIRESFYELLEEAEWMDDASRIVAKEKAKAIAEKIGYPDYILNNTALDEEFKNVDFHPSKYFQNVLTTIRHATTENLKRLREPVDRTVWSTYPVVVNAFYSSGKNQIMFPAGLLQPPFYNKGFPKSLNYGGIGMVIGHEITHGFDDKGRQFDKDGNLIQWWDDEVIRNFKKEAQCIIDQYSNFTLPEVSVQVNGIATQGENIADNGGLKEAYRAFMKWKVKHRTEIRLPGIEDLSSEQLFFLNFAQIWCGSLRPEAAINHVLSGAHTPGRFRVIGTLQNSHDFARVFSCPSQSYMNKQPKCSVW